MFVPRCVDRIVRRLVRRSGADELTHEFIDGLIERHIDARCDGAGHRAPVGSTVDSPGHM
jgi:hypothetical protein